MLNNIQKNSKNADKKAKEQIVKRAEASKDKIDAIEKAEQEQDLGQETRQEV